MADKTIFIAFAKEDQGQRDLLSGQEVNASTPFEFIDMSIKKPFDSAWKTQVREVIQGCDGVIALVSENTADADGELWEIECAKDEDKPLIGLWAYADDRSKPAALAGVTIIEWTWDGIGEFIDSL